MENKQDNKESAVSRSVSSDLLDAALNWQPIETAPKDGRAILLLSQAYDMDVGEASGGIIHVAPKVAIGHWKADGTSWVDELGSLDGEAYTLAETGVWLSGGGWFEPNEVTHWREMPLPPEGI
jgi:hypothetical protein